MLLPVMNHAFVEEVSKIAALATPGFSPELEEKIRRTYPGQAHFAGTGPFAATCGNCVFLGYSKQRRSSPLLPRPGIPVERKKAGPGQQRRRERQSDRHEVHRRLFAVL